MLFTDDNLNPVEQGIFDKAVDALGPLERDAHFTCRKASCGRSGMLYCQRTVADLSDTLNIWERLAVLGKSIHLLTLNYFR